MLANRIQICCILSLQEVLLSGLLHRCLTGLLHRFLQERVAFLVYVVEEVVVSGVSELFSLKEAFLRDKAGLVVRHLLLRSVALLALTV